MAYRITVVLDNDKAFSILDDRGPGIVETRIEQMVSQGAWETTEDGKVFYPARRIQEISVREV